MFVLKTVISTKGNVNKVSDIVKSTIDNSTLHIAEVCQRAAQRNLRQVSFSGELRDSVVIRKLRSGELNKGNKYKSTCVVAVEEPYGMKFELGQDSSEPKSIELEYWVRERAERGYFGDHKHKVITKLMKHKYLDTHYSKSPAKKFFSRAIEFTRNRARSVLYYDFTSAIARESKIKEKLGY